MILKYNCPNCGRELITRYLMPGDKLTCPGCDSEIEVPQDAITTDQEPNLYNKTTPPILWPPHILDSIIVSGDDVTVPSDQNAQAEATTWNVYSVLKFIPAFILSVAVVSSILAIMAAFIMGPFYPSGDYARKIFKFDFLKVLGYIVTFTSMILPTVLIFYSVVKHHHNKFFEALRLVKMARQEFTRYVLVGAGCVGAVIALVGLLVLTGLDKNMPKDMPILEEFRHGYTSLLIYTLVALLAPTFEEIIFRGYIFQGLKTSFGVRVAAIIVTAAFILLHAPQLGYGVLPLLLLSVVSVTLIYVRIKTDSLTKCIVIHQIYNTILIAIVWSTALLFGIDKLAA